MKKLDVLITSASRPQSLKTQMETFLKRAKFSGKFNFYLHEDRVPGMEDRSKDLEKWAINSHLFADVKISDPRIGRGPALNYLKQFVQSKYVWYMEEDFDFIKSISLDKLIDLMDKHENINQIAFNFRSLPKIPKPGGPNGQEYFLCENRKFSGHTLHVSERWTWQPALWRTSWVMPRWNFDQRRSNKGFNRKLKAGIGLKEWDLKWHEENVGAYYYGKNTSKPYVKHTSWDIRHDRDFL